MIILIILTHLVTSQIHLLSALSLYVLYYLHGDRAMYLDWNIDAKKMFKSCSNKKKLKFLDIKNVLILISAESCCACWLGNKKIQFIKNRISE